MSVWDVYFGSNNFKLKVKINWMWKQSLNKILNHCYHKSLFQDFKKLVQLKYKITLFYFLYLFLYICLIYFCISLLYIYVILLKYNENLHICMRSSMCVIYKWWNIHSIQSLSHVPLFVTPWIAACQAFLCITNSWSSFKLMSIESVMPSSHLILCHPLLLLPPIPPSNRVFSNESALHMRWPKYWSFSFSISPSTPQPGIKPILPALEGELLSSGPKGESPEYFSMTLKCKQY